MLNSPADDVDVCLLVSVVVVVGLCSVSPDEVQCGGGHGSLRWLWGLPVEVELFCLLLQPLSGEEDG